MLTPRLPATSRAPLAPGRSADVGAFRQRRAAAAEALTFRSPVAWLVMGYFFYLPLAHFPPMPLIRNVILTLPQAGGFGAETITPWILLLPDFVFAIALLLITVLNPRTIVPGTWLRTVVALMIAAFLLGGLVASAGSQFPGLSLTGLTGRLAVLIVAWVILARPPGPRVARAWLLAAIAGASVVMLAGLMVYLQTFGWPETLAELPQHRSELAWDAYGKVTYGHSGNTSGVLVLMLPPALALIAFGRGLTRERVFLIAAAALMVVNLFFAFQRWALIDVVLTIVALLWFSRSARRNFWLYPVATVALIFAGNAVAATLGDYFEDALASTSESNLDTRFATWRFGLGEIRRHPAGVGFDQVSQLEFQGFGSSHSLLIDSTLEGGILVSLAIVVWMGVTLVGIMRMLWKPSRQQQLSFAFFVGPAAFILWGVFFYAQVLAGSLVWFAAWVLFPIVGYALLQMPDADAASDLPAVRGVSVSGDRPRRRGTRP